jgi:acylglycerol lipase
MDNDCYISEIIEKHDSFDLLAFERKKSNGNFVYGRFYKATGHATQTILLFHGLGDHIGRHNDFVHAYIKNSKVNTNFLMFDYHGHGKSSGNRGHIESFSQLSLDAIEVLNQFSEEIKDTSLFLLGLGVGCLISLKMLSEFFNRIEFKINGLIMLNPAFKWKGKIPQYRDLIFRKGSLLSKVKVPFLLSGKDICSDSILAQEFDRDPLVNHRFSWTTFWEFKKNASLLRTSAYYLEIPLFIGISKRDRLFDYKITELFSRALDRSTIKYYEVSDHDLFHSMATPNLIEDVSKWMEKQ